VLATAIVMAAGEGRRLRPLTERWAKPALPIDGRPVVGTLLRELATAGVQQATVVTGHLAEQVEALLGDGSAYGVDVTYVRQPEPDGSADAVRRAFVAGAPMPTLVLGADTVFTSGDVGRFAAAFVASGAAGAISGRRRPPPSPPHRFGLRVENGLVTAVRDSDRANPLAGAPLWALGPDLVEYVERATTLPFNAPYELADAAQLAIDDGLAIAGIEIGQTRDLTYPIDLVMENFPYLRSFENV
jgi:NDP-sugar pyrophosphorylase family protein